MTVQLELVAERSRQPTHAPPLLFVHGAWHAAWCWQTYFLPYFAQQGYDAYALSLRGHGGSLSAKPLRWLRLRDYVEDVTEVAARLPDPPVLIGHSMGGAIVQRYLEHHEAAGAVFLASVPPSGPMGTTLRVARRMPLPFMKAILTLRLYALLATPERARALLFSGDLPDRLLKSFHQRLQDESFLAYVDMLLLALRPSRPCRIPALVLGSRADAMISPSDVNATARICGTQPVLLSGIGHNMMLEPQWQEAADLILAWLRRHF